MQNDQASLPLISVIVPIYNMSGRMDLCLRCLTGQTYRNLEILLVDDGSTDDSWARIQKWAAWDARIRPLHKENGGVSSARNYGLDRMQGDYVTFVDPDDAFSSHMIQWLYEALGQCDVPLSTCRILPRRAAEAAILPPEPAAPGAARKVALTEYDHWGAYAHVQCYGALYRADLLQGLRFDETLTYAEDLLFFTHALLRAKTTAALMDQLYYYVEWNDSALHRPYTATQFTDVLVWERVCTLGKDISPLFYESARTHYMFACTRAFYYSFTSQSDCTDIRREAVRRLRQNRQAVWAMPPICRKERIKALLAMVSPALGEALWRLTKRFSHS